MDKQPPNSLIKKLTEVGCLQSEQLVEESSESEEFTSEKDFVQKEVIKTVDRKEGKSMF